MDAFQLIKDLDAPLVVVSGTYVMLKIIKFLREEITREREEKEAVIVKLEAATADRFTDKDTAAKQFHDTIVGVERTLQRVADSRASVLEAMQRIAQKVGA